MFCKINVKQEEKREEEKESACRAAYPQITLTLNTSLKVFFFLI